MFSLRGRVCGECCGFEFRVECRIWGCGYFVGRQGVKFYPPALVFRLGGEELAW